MGHAATKTRWGKQDTPDFAKERENWYIAAPFFNEQQVTVVKQIEKALMETGRKFFSPRLSIPSITAKKEGLTADLAKRIFQVNVDMLNVACNRVVAYFGWEVEVSPEWSQDRFMLTIPDAGTVWEAGYAASSAIPIFGIFGKDQKPNLMLTQSCDATFEDVESFRIWLEAYDAEPNIVLPKWKGLQQ